MKSKKEFKAETAGKEGGISLPPKKKKVEEEKSESAEQEQHQAKPELSQKQSLRRDYFLVPAAIQPA